MTPTQGAPWSWVASGLKGHQETFAPHLDPGVLGSKASGEDTARAGVSSELCCRHQLEQLSDPTTEGGEGGRGLSLGFGTCAFQGQSCGQPQAKPCWPGAQFPC